ncbi:3'-5' exonuclease [Sporolactobacillus sp. CQH2019]|uniref:3'-5' exonuclease n=1 Tax=Sporolactobacillus sp. CQH2019 TaxID=3023512 RepID=UPI002367AAA3|nr:3'-5' exonuclease [Sporolactobacillus sp. CQH2019]MDD9149225.1 3'-5' exonuclease [Sporolactobacillus sp. CQH2019]
MMSVILWLVGIAFALFVIFAIIGAIIERKEAQQKQQQVTTKKVNCPNKPAKSLVQKLRDPDLKQSEPLDSKAPINDEKVDFSKKSHNQQLKEILDMVVETPPVKEPTVEPDIRFVTPHIEHRQANRSRYIKARKLSSAFTVIDFETTGLSPETSEIIQIGAVKYADGKIVDTFSSYIKPQFSKLSSRITNITGITEDMLVDAPIIQDVLPKFIEYIKCQTLVAHNASFDMKFLFSACDRCQINTDRFRVIDTLFLSRRLIGGVTNYKLETLKKELGLGTYKSHDALGDCYTTGILYLNCYQKAQ